MKSIYITLSGDNSGDGSREKPVADFGRAAELARAERGDAEIVFGGGIHYLSETIEVGRTLARPDRRLTIRGEEGAALSGGARVSGWEPVEQNGRQMFRAALPQYESIRTFTVNGEPRKIATKFHEDKKSFGWIGGTNLQTIEIRFADIGQIRNPAQLEVVWIAEWKTFIYRAAEVEGNLLKMAPSFERITSIVKLSMQTDHDPNGYWWPCAGRHKVYLQNDLSFLENRGEFCFDEREKMLYYYPYLTENLEECECSAARLDCILDVHGEAEKKAENLIVENLVFSDGDFSMIAREGIGINQAQSYYAGIAKWNPETGKIDIPYNQYDANININYAKNIRFSACTFRNLTKGGVYFHDGVEDSSVIGCAFSSIGDSSIIVGDGMHGYIGESGIDRNISIENNLIRNTSQIVFSAPGIQCYFVKNLKIRHNDVYGTGYGGINVGWGWTVCLDNTVTENVLIEGNRIGNFANKVHDCGGIYTLGQAPRSICRRNYLFEQMAAFGALYHDEGSSGYDTYENVVNSNTHPEDREMTWLWMNGFFNGPNGIYSVYDIEVHDNWFNNPREESGRIDAATSKVWNNKFVEGDRFPPEALRVIQESGLEPQFRGLFEKI